MVAVREERPHTYRMAKAEGVAVLRTELEGIEPLIWRRVAVRPSISLMGVHLAIQAAMGWQDSHLWYFETGERRYAPRLRSEPEWNERYEDAGRQTLGRLLASGVRRMNYIYDMGDFWEHLVVIEKIASPLSGQRYPQFLGGERR